MSDRGLPIGVRHINGYGSHFAEVELAAYSPSNIVPGISFSPDKMLQARVFSYADAHRYRLGTHYGALPVNAPQCPVNHYHKDGQMRFFENFKNADAYYEPNSFDGPIQSLDYAEPPLKISGDAARYNHREDNDDYGQPRALFNLFDDSQSAKGLAYEVDHPYLVSIHKRHLSAQAGVLALLKSST